MPTGTNGEEPEPFAERVRRLAEAKDLSPTQVGYLAFKQDARGTSPATLQKVIRGERPLNVALLEAVARALDVPPEEFPEYRLAVARRALDEREVGLGEALDMLAAIEQALAG